MIIHSFSLLCFCSSASGLGFNVSAPLADDNMTLLVSDKKIYCRSLLFLFVKVTLKELSCIYSCLFCKCSPSYLTCINQASHLWNQPWLTKLTKDCNFLWVQYVQRVRDKDFDIGSVLVCCLSSFDHVCWSAGSAVRVKSWDAGIFSRLWSC